MTVPVGVPDAVFTVAVKVTFCPTTDGFADDVNAVVVAAAAGVFTTCVKTDDALDALLASPL